MCYKVNNLSQPGLIKFSYPETLKGSCESRTSTALRTPAAMTRACACGPSPSDWRRRSGWESEENRTGQPSCSASRGVCQRRPEKSLGFLFAQNYVNLTRTKFPSPSRQFCQITATVTALPVSGYELKLMQPSVKTRCAVG